VKRAVLAVLVVVVLAACSGGQRGPGGGGGGDVSLRDWCAQLTPLVCKRVGSCVGSEDIADGCIETAIPSCIAGRDGNKSSGHDEAELEACATVFKTTACEGYGDAIAAHTECQATTPE
jgi:hypothetical protein